MLSKFLEKAAEARLEAYNVQPKAFSGIHSYGLDIYGDAQDFSCALAETFQCLAQPDFVSLPYKQLSPTVKTPVEKYYGTSKMNSS